MSDFLDQKRAEITKRLNELKPMVEEYQRLEEASRALAGVTGSRLSAPATRASAPAAKRAGSTRRRGPGRPRKSATTAAASSAAATTPKRRGGGRPKGSGLRAAQAVELVGKNPGITIPELAGKMGIKQNYLYRVLPPLEKEGKISRQGRGWFPAGS
jgi:hypothetical protein